MFGEVLGANTWTPSIKIRCECMEKCECICVGGYVCIDSNLARKQVACPKRGIFHLDIQNLKKKINEINKR